MAQAGYNMDGPENWTNMFRQSGINMNPGASMTPQGANVPGINPAFTFAPSRLAPKPQPGWFTSSSPFPGHLVAPSLGATMQQTANQMRSGNWFDPQQYFANASINPRYAGFLPGARTQGLGQAMGGGKMGPGSMLGMGGGKMGPGDMPGSLLEDYLKRGATY